MATPSIDDTVKAINSACHKKGGIYSEYSCKFVSWDDVQRGTVGGGLSCWGSNITDTYLKSKDGRQLFTVRSDNWNEKLGVVNAKDVKLISGNQFQGNTHEDLENITLKDFLTQIKEYGGYTGLDVESLENEDLDKRCSIRFQTTFLPVDEEEFGNIEFSTEAYNYNTTSDSDPRNLVLLASSQGLALQQDGEGAKRIFHHAIDEESGDIKRYWLEAERSKHKVGGEQKETKEEKEDAIKRGKAVSNTIGIEAMGSRFNVLLTVQIPLKQKNEEVDIYSKSVGCAYFGDDSEYDDEMYAMPKMMKCMAAGPVYKEAVSMTYAVEEKLCYAEAKELTCTAPMMEVEECIMEELSEESIVDEITETIDIIENINLNQSASIDVLKRRSSIPEPEKPVLKEGIANAARVSRGSEEDTWSGLTVETPVRNEYEHLTISVVIYFTVAGGVPSEKDVLAAIDDMEMLYNACNAKGRLADEEFDFMKKELTVKDVLDINKKITEQPKIQESKEKDPKIEEEIAIYNIVEKPKTKAPKSKKCIIQ